MRHPESADERFARALAEADAYRRRRDGGSGERLEEWLSAREDLRELLEPMLEAEGGERTASTTERAEGAAGNQAAGLRHFAHFRILGALGGGGMGDVYLAEDEKLGRKVALKMIRPEALWSQDAKLRFQRETMAVGQLDHPNICKLYEAGEHDGWPFMALQHIAGETLAQMIEQSRAERSVRGSTSATSAPTTRAHITAIVEMIEKVARALHHAHEHGLVHRDIKPGNIMIDGDGQPVVLDFGLVRDIADPEASLASSRRGVGTPLYMSPEQIRRAGRVDARTDIYSLGVTLYECLTHERPFDGTTEAELADCILANRYRDPRAHNRQLPPELGLVIACALDPDPERRYRTALAMAEDLRRVLLLQPVHARPVETLLRLQRWAQRNPTLLGVSALAGVALIGLAIALERTAEAHAQQGIATVRADEASTSLDRFRLLSDVVKLREAEAIEPSLYPALPENAPAMREWLTARGEPLAQRLPKLEAALAELQGDATPGGGRFLRQALIQLIADVRAFQGENGALPAVRRRLREAESVYEMTIENHRVEWNAAITAIAKSDDATASRLYDHLIVAPQVGLVPIGMDQASKLWEFAHVASGAIARRDPQNGRLAIEDDTGIVFVLLPAGTFWMGAQRNAPGARNFDPFARPDESPVHEVVLSAFFLAKHEMTQGQWQRLSGGETPAYFKPELDWAVQQFTPCHPVESVNWSMGNNLLQRQGLELPTEAQWEYGCRAGSTTPWWSGGAKESLHTSGVVANVADLTALQAEFAREPIAWPRLDDGYIVHAPVGSFVPNGFGLHDTYGNVKEWCRDGSGSYAAPAQSGDGFRVGDSSSHPSRGGAWDSGHGLARSAARDWPSLMSRNSRLGLRPARAIKP